MAISCHYKEPTCFCLLLCLMFILHLHNCVILDVIKYCDHPRWYEKIPPGGGTSDWRCHLQLEVGPLIGGGTSNWRWHLWLEVSPPIRGGTSNRRWLMHVGPHRGTHVTCRNQLFFWKKRDYLLLITSSHHLSTRWNVNLLSFVICFMTTLLALLPPTILLSF